MFSVFVTKNKNPVSALTRLFYRRPMAHTKPSGSPDFEHERWNCDMLSTGNPQDYFHLLYTRIAIFQPANVKKNDFFRAFARHQGYASAFFPPRIIMAMPPSAMTAETTKSPLNFSCRSTPERNAASSAERYPYDPSMEDGT